MLYFTTETLSHGEKPIYYFTTRAGEEGLRTENIRLTTGFLQAGHAVEVLISKPPSGLIFTTEPGSCWRAF